MATPLFKAVNSLNQKVADIVQPSYIQWNIEQNTWFVHKTGFGKPFDWLNWHRLRVLACFLWFAVTGIYSCWVWVNYPGILNIQKLALIGLVGLSVIPLVFLFEYGYMKYAVEHCDYNNWANKKLEELTLPKPNVSSKRTLFKIILSEYSKVYQREKNNVDWWGLAALNTYACFYPATFTLPGIMVFADMDLSYIWLYTLSSPRLLGMPSLYENFLGKIFRGIIQGILMQSSSITLSTCMLLVGNNFQATLGIIKHSKSKPALNQGVLYLYREFYLGQYLLGPLYKICNTLFLTPSFFELVIATNLILLGYPHLPFKMYIMAPVILVFMLGLVLVVLTVEGFVYHATSQLLSQWKWLTHTGRGRYGIVKKMLRSFRPISCPCGDVGIIDRDIKINYMLAVLDRSIELLLLFKA